AGFPGLVSKLWLSHDEHDVYRGLYEWDGAERAEHYARCLWRVLALVSVRGSRATSCWQPPAGSRRLQTMFRAGRGSSRSMATQAWCRPPGPSALQRERACRQDDGDRNE